MKARTTRRLPLCVAGALLASVSATGCSPDDAPVSATVHHQSKATSSTGPDSQPPVAVSARLVPAEEGGSIRCVEKTTRNEVASLYDPVAKAHGDLIITDVRAIGTDVKLLGADGVVVTSRPGFGPGSMIGDQWPIPKDANLVENTDLSTRHSLRGMTLTDGQRVLPLFAVRVNAGSVLDGLEVTYTGADDKTSTVVLEVGTRFNGGPCHG